MLFLSIFFYISWKSFLKPLFLQISLKKHGMLYRVTVKNSKNSNGIRLERGMSVDVVTNSMSNPVTTNGGQPVVDAFMRIYGIDIRKAGALSMAWLDVERIG